MQKLQALVDHLNAQKVVRPEQCRGVMESGEPQGSFDQSGPDLLIFRHRYVARVVLEKTPHNVTHFLACAHAWLEEFGGEEDRIIGWVGEPSDDRLGDVDLQVEFEEEAHYVVKPGGYGGREIVTWRGTEYVPGATDPDTATDVEMEGSTE